MSSENTSDNDQAPDRQRVTESRNENGRGDLRQMGILATAAKEMQPTLIRSYVPA